MRVRVPSRVMRTTATDARGRGNSGRGRRGRNSTVVARPTLLVTLFGVCFNRRCGHFVGLGSGVAHASDRGGVGMFSVFFWLLERDDLSS